MCTGSAALDGPMPWVTPSVWSVRTSSMTSGRWSASSIEPCHASNWRDSTIRRPPRLQLRIHAGSQATRVGAGVGAGVVPDGVPGGRAQRTAAPDLKEVVVTAAETAVAVPAVVLPEEVLSGPVGSARPTLGRPIGQSPNQCGRSVGVIPNLSGANRVLARWHPSSMSVVLAALLGWAPTAAVGNCALPGAPQERGRAFARPPCH